jgi:hypothetical protein
MAGFTEIGIWVNLRTAERARRLADGLSTLGTEHSFRLIDSTTERALLTTSHLLLLLLLHNRLLRLIFSYQFFLAGSFLWPESPLRPFGILSIIVYHSFRL